MNAREALIIRRPDVYREPEWASIVDKVLALHAHELAEMIRKYNTDHSNDTYWAADLIDPEE